MALRSSLIRLHRIEIKAMYLLCNLVCTIQNVIKIGGCSAIAVAVAVVAAAIIVAAKKLVGKVKRVGSQSGKW